MAEDTIHARPNARAVPLNWAEHYIGLPYKDLGFDRTGCSCWGLVCMIYEEQLSISLPKYDTITPDQFHQMIGAFKSEFAGSPWKQLQPDEARDFDIVLLRERNLPVHVGVAVGKDKVVHVESGTNSMCVRRNHPFFRGRILGFYRYMAER